MVDARRDFYAVQGLMASTRFVASTGIEAQAIDPRSLVSMDCLSLGNIMQEQILTMNALENMPPTIEYGVTFERGLRIKFGDRSHLYISGTASIDQAGKILFEGNVEKQTITTLDNVEALLKNQRASLADLSHILCYVRNAKDHAGVAEILKDRLDRNMPAIIVQAPVCRPGWLVEMEGVAIIPDTNNYPPFM
jgi:enamine deaminase RidA (YjgF/YER057c/UK114 family)